MRKRSIVEAAHEVVVPVQWGAEVRMREKQGREERERGREGGRGERDQQR